MYDYQKKTTRWIAVGIMFFLLPVFIMIFLPLVKNEILYHILKMISLVAISISCISVIKVMETNSNVKKFIFGFVPIIWISVFLNTRIENIIIFSYFLIIFLILLVKLLKERTKNNFTALLFPFIFYFLYFMYMNFDLMGRIHLNFNTNFLVWFISLSIILIALFYLGFLFTNESDTIKKKIGVFIASTIFAILISFIVIMVVNVSFDFGKKDYQEFTIIEKEVDPGGPKGRTSCDLKIKSNETNETFTINVLRYEYESLNINDEIILEYSDGLLGIDYWIYDFKWKLSDKWEFID